MSLTVLSQPAEEPITLTEAKAHLRVTDTAEDTLITSLIQAAREYCEELQGRAYVTRTYRLDIDATDEAISLLMPPFIAVSSVYWIDEDDVATEITSDDYVINTTAAVATLTLDELESDAVYLRITYTAGYGTASDVPQRIKQAMLLLIGQWYQFREITQGQTVEQREVPFAVSALLGMDRVNYGGI